MDHSRNGTLMQTLTTSLQQGKGQELHNIKHPIMTNNCNKNKRVRGNISPKIAPIQNSTEKNTPSPRAIYFRGYIAVNPLSGTKQGR